MKLDRGHVLGRTEEGIGLVPQIHGVLLASVGIRLKIGGARRVAKSLASRHEKEPKQDAGVESDQIGVVFGMAEGTTDIVVTEIDLSSGVRDA